MINPAHLTDNLLKAKEAMESNGGNPYAILCHEDSHRLLLEHLEENKIFGLTVKMCKSCPNDTIYIVSKDVYKLNK